eukprot:Rhum_TRINITY_DN3216_c0_g1::Rhum_TRINITY_DN3216_c0_g1_i1::g.10020::m.10020/K11096/SNRPD2, SMD2; small nuclear ribonucleoprotein D2
MSKRPREEDEGVVEAKRPREEEENENDDVENGPMSILKQAIQSDKEVLIFCRSGKKLTAKVKAFDRHMNMVLENVQELWTEIPKVKSGEKPKVQNKFRHIPKMFLRGDIIILVVKNPGALVGQ